MALGQGGLKAVVWTDAFQMVVMVVGFLTVLVQGASRAGGVTAVWESAQRGRRLDVFEYVRPSTATVTYCIPAATHYAPLHIA